MNLNYQIQLNFPEDKTQWKVYYPLPSSLKKAEKAYLKVCREVPEATVRLISILEDSIIPYEVLEYREARKGA